LASERLYFEGLNKKIRSDEIFKEMKQKLIEKDMKEATFKPILINKNSFVVI